MLLTQGGREPEQPTFIGKTRMGTNKLIPSLMFAALFLGMGCRSHYDITLRNQTVITSIGKPRYDRANEVYRFKDAQGNIHSVPAVSVSSISAR